MAAAIVYYTEREGGTWVSCAPIEVPTDKKLQHMQTEARAVSQNYIKIGRYEIHSFKTKDGKEWDVVNGWRKGTPL